MTARAGRPKVLIVEQMELALLDHGVDDLRGGLAVKLVEVGNDLRNCVRSHEFLELPRLNINKWSPWFFMKK
jgi:hypothetical protein